MFCWIKRGGNIAYTNQVIAAQVNNNNNNNNTAANNGSNTKDNKDNTNANPEAEHKITIPGYGFGLASGIVTVITTALLYYLIFHATPLASFLKDTFFEMYVFTVFFLIGNLVCAIIMIAASFMIRHEENALAGSILILIISAIGMVFSIGLWIGPILGIISGMLGLKEHHQLMKTHHRMIHEHDRVIGLCHNLIEEHYALMNAHKKLMRKRSR